MHLIWENNVDNLLSHWIGSFKGLDDGRENYQFSKTVWDAISEATALSGSTIPSAYGARVPNISTHRSLYSAEMKLFWTMYIGPVLLHGCFDNIRYYKHFVRFVRIINLCLQFEITNEEVEDVRKEIITWVKDYKDIYYEHDVERLSACPVTVHALLHIADSIKSAGPVWCYWAYPMERYCGQLQPTIKSRRFPYASIDRYVTEEAQLTQIKVTHDLFEKLALRAPRGEICGSCRVPEYPICVLLPPRVTQRPTEHIQSIVAAIATRFNISISNARTCVMASSIDIWGRLCRVDTSAGDTFRAAGLGIVRDDSRDASFVRYQVLVDIYARQRCQKPKFEMKTLSGQLQNIYLVRIPATCFQKLRLESPSETILILAGIQTCRLDNTPSSLLESLDIHFYTTLGGYDVVDITTIQSLVGRVKSGGRQWAIIDRSGTLAQALYTGDDEDEND
ncbi:hypothetical protein H0H93_013741 [Arthromyces matolae]|nr:hypothetical protein H0H93_013741 [Arthromyces matolae]